MQAVSLHRDVIVVTSAVLSVNCVIVRGHQDPVNVDASADATGAELMRCGVAAMPDSDSSSVAAASDQAAETFVIDSPVLPDELDALPALVEQAAFPEPSGLLVTHGDWDHLLGGLAFPKTSIGCAESTIERLRSSPGDAQRRLRAFDEDLLIERARPLALGALQALPVPGRCELGGCVLELHATSGHTNDGMAVLIDWAGVLVAGDYLSTVEMPTLDEAADVEAYLTTLLRMRELLDEVEHVVPGHGPTLDSASAVVVLEEDVLYLQALRRDGASAELPPRCRTAASRRAHSDNAEKLDQRQAGQVG